MGYDPYSKYFINVKQNVEHWNITNYLGGEEHTNLYNWATKL